MVKARRDGNTVMANVAARLTKVKPAIRPRRWTKKQRSKTWLTTLRDAMGVGGGSIWCKRMLGCVFIACALMWWEYTGVRKACEALNKNAKLVMWNAVRWLVLVAAVYSAVVMTLECVSTLPVIPDVNAISASAGQVMMEPATSM